MKYEDSHVSVFQFRWLVILFLDLIYFDVDVDVGTNCSDVIGQYVDITVCY